MGLGLDLGLAMLEVDSIEDFEFPVLVDHARVAGIRTAVLVLVAVDRFLRVRALVFAIGDAVAIAVLVLFGATVGVAVAIAVFGDVRALVLVVGHAVVVAVVHGGREAHAQEDAKCRD